MKKGIQLVTAIPGPRSLELMAHRNKNVARGVYHVTPIFSSSAKGSIIYDVDGNQLIDFSSGIGTTNLGHLHPHVTENILHQLDQSLHLSFNVTPYQSYGQVCEKLNQSTPGTFSKKSFLANSGAEAVENAVKMARCHTKRQAIIGFDHSFHGRTYCAMSLTSKSLYKQGFGPFVPEMYHAPFPYPYRWPTPHVVEECFEQFEYLMNTRIHPSHVAAVIFEPVLGEGGFLPMPKAFAQRLQQYCRKHSIVLIADEIQSGFGRTGSLFACEQLDIEPDLLLTAKALSGGMILSAVTGRAEIVDAPVEGGIGGTFGGHPLSCAAALAVFDEFEDGKLLLQSQRLGKQLSSRLHIWKSRFPEVGDIRGMGPMMAMELIKNDGKKTPNPLLTKQLIEYCFQNGVVIMGSGSFGNVIRFLMPLTIDDDLFEEGLQVVEDGMVKLSFS